VFRIEKFINAVNHKRVNIANKISFLPGIQATLQVSAGCKAKMSENSKERALSYFNFSNKDNSRQEAIKWRTTFVRWYTRGSLLPTCASKMNKMFIIGRYRVVSGVRKTPFRNVDGIFAKFLLK
jgi:hypothetical protein